MAVSRFRALFSPALPRNAYPATSMRGRPQAVGRLRQSNQMAMFNYLALNIICPRCGVETEMEADFRFGLRDLTYYRIGDRLRWDGMGVRTPEARPEEGNYDDEAHVVCPHCKRDFWLAVSIRQDIIVRAMVDPTKQPYIFDGNRQPQETNGPVQSKWEPRAHTEKMKKKHLTTCFCVFLD
jgi:hypothetical protein